MKKIGLLIAVLFLLIAAEISAKPLRSGISFGFFYSSLQPYGEWIEVDVDLFAWRPYNVHRRWAPYSDGRWVWTRHGWYWDSYEPYGWATYHYGRWHYDDYYGWIWLPDYEWGPAWVEWRYDDDYIGWAPLPPYAVFNVNFGIHFSYDWHFPYHHWHYVRYNNFCDYNVNNYFIGNKHKYRIHSRTKYRNDYDYRDGRVINRGVDRDIVERRSRQKIEERDIVETSRLRSSDGERGRERNRVEVYRPGRDELNRAGNVEKFDIKRPERKISIETSKVGARTIVRDRNNNSDRITQRKDSERETINRNNRNDEKAAQQIERRENIERRTDNQRKIKDVPEPRKETPGIERRIEERESPRIQKESPRREERRVEQKREERREVEKRTSSPSVERRPNAERQERKTEQRSSNNRSGGSEKRSRERR